MHNLSPLSFVTAIVISTPIAISQQASVNPTLRFMMSHNPTVPTKIINQKIDEPVTYLPVIVRLTSPNQTLPSFATELHRRGTIAIVTVPRDRLSELQGASGVRRLESRLCVTPALDHARTFCSLPEVLNQTTATGAALNGKDVVVGFCDIGFDPNHPNFLNNEGLPRTVRLVNYVLTSPTPVVLNEPEMIVEWTTDDAKEFHATHVAGILAGSYEVDNMQGIATAAEIVATTSPLYDGYLLAGAEQILDYAKTTGKPAVVNMSISSEIGPHDGTTLFNQYLDMFTDEATVCISAGNEGNRYGHVHHTATAEVPAVRTYFRQYPNLLLSRVTGMVDIWSSDSTPLSLTLVNQQVHGTNTVTSTALPIDLGNGISECVICSDEYVSEFPGILHLSLPEEAKGYIHVAAEINPENNRFNAAVTCAYQYREADGSGDAPYLLGIEATPEKIGTTVDFYSSNDIYFVRHYDRSLVTIMPETFNCVNDFVIGDGVISVGSMNTYNIFTTLNGSTLDFTSKLSLGDISYFSSYGATPEGVKLPTVVAPGAQLVSSLSSYYTETYPSYRETNCTISHSHDGRDYYWGPEQGTSMSSPFTAGTVALWLQANPALNGKEIKEIINSTVTKPSVNPNKLQWGQGMLDATSGLQRARELASVQSVVSARTSDDLSVKLYGNILTVSHTLQPISAIYITRPDGMQIAAMQPHTCDVSIDCSDFASGIYLIHTFDHQGQSRTSKILIK